jgi:hypothetical protein
MKIKLLLPAKEDGDSLLIEPKRTKVYFKIRHDNDGFIVCTDKYKLREICELSNTKTMKAIRKCPKKLGMRFHK